MDESNWIELPHGRLHYWKFGQGPQLLLALHGFGEDGYAFANWAEALDEKWTVLAPDLPWHGQTCWNHAIWKRSDVLYWIQEMITRHGYSSFHCVGYSMGGRLALSLTPFLSEKLTGITLFAPDGLATRDMWIASRIPAWFRRCLILVAEPGGSWALRIAEKAYVLGIMTGFGLKYLRYQWSNKTRRLRMMRTWSAMAYFPVRVPQIKMTLQKRKIPFRLVLGENDNMIKREEALLFTEGLEQAECIVFSADHRLIGPETAAFF